MIVIRRGETNRIACHDCGAKIGKGVPYAHIYVQNKARGFCKKCMVLATAKLIAGLAAYDGDFAAQDKNAPDYAASLKAVKEAFVEISV